MSRVVCVKSRLYNNIKSVRYSEGSLTESNDSCSQKGRKMYETFRNQQSIKRTGSHV